MHRIGSFAALTQIPVKTLRFYDEIGILRPASVDRKTGYRTYVAAQIEDLNRILVLKDLGFSLREIKVLLLDHVPADQMRAMLRQKRVDLERAARRDRARLARAEARLDALERSGQGSAYDVAVRDVPVRFVASLRGDLSSHREQERLFDELRHGCDAERRVRGAIFHACAPDAVDCEALLFLPARTALRGRIRARELPAERVASLVYRGDKDFVSAYRAMRTWISASGAEIIGPKREIYLDEDTTEIQFPIQGGDA